MPDQSLAGRDAFVIGAVDEMARRVAVALAEAGATVSTTTFSNDQQQTFRANSILNEVWSLGRAGAAFTIDEQNLEELQDAVERSAAPMLVVMPPPVAAHWIEAIADELPVAASIVISADGGSFTLQSDDQELRSTTYESLPEMVVRLATDLSNR